jgi:2,3-dihydroxy-p-cumate/2,3-dihydroxybenzoate 3,4-dioxygenase
MTPPTHPFRYKKLGYVALNVTNVERTHEFVNDIYGLDAAGVGEGGERYYRVCSDHHSVILYPARTAGFKRAGWQLDDANEVSKAFAHFSNLGWKPHWVAEEERIPLGLAQSSVFRVREPFTGCLFEYFDRIEQTVVPFSHRLAKIERLGHFGISAPDPLAGAAHFEKNLGFIASDYVGKYAVLMRIFGSPLHHSMGLAFAPQTHFQHVNCMVKDIDDIGRAIWRLKKHDVKVVFGPGRHPTSDSIFIYFHDPDGLTWEYSFGMELFPEENYRPARIMGTAPADIDLWGAGMEPDFGKYGNIEGEAA